MTGPDDERLLAHTAWVQELARSVCARRDLAADVAQETLVVAWRRGLAGVHDVRAFLATILRRLAGRRTQDAWRRTRRDAELPAPDPSPPAADVVAKAAMQREVVDAVLRLAEPYRTTILLRWLEQRSPGEIAAQMRVPLETVRTRCRRGLRALRDDLDRRHRDARTWAMPLLGIAGVDEATAAGAPAAAAGAAFAAAGTGAVVMSVQTKLTVALAVVAAALVAWTTWPAAAGGPPAVQREGTTPSAVVVAPLAQPPRGATDGERTAVPAAPEAGSAALATAASLPVWRAHGRVVDELTNAGVRGATVRFTRGSYGRVAGGAECATTGDDGTFALVFERSSPGFVELVVQHPQFGASHVPLLEVIGRAEAAGGRDAAIGDVVLARGARIGGRVLAADGATPVAGARVLHYRAALGAPMRFFEHAVEVARSGDDGRFTLPDRLAPGYRRQWLTAVTDGAIGWRELQPSRREHDDAAFDVVLRAAASVRVRVTAAGGEALPGAVATAHPLAEPLSSLFEPASVTTNALPPFLRALTGDDGGASLLVPIADDGVQFGVTVPGGRCTLRVVAAGHRQWQRQLDLRAGEHREIVVALAAAGLVRAAGRVLDGDGGPVAGAVVGCGEREAVADAAGVFDLPAVDATPGRITLAARANGFVPMLHTVDCSAPGDRFDVELRLARAREVRGVVVDESGTAVAGALVSVAGGAQQQTGADGRFELANVARDADRLLVHSLAGVFATAIVPLPAAAASAGAVELRVEVQRRRGPTVLEVSVLDRASGRALEPLHGVLVALGEPRTLVARPLQVRDGWCHDTDVPPGRYRLEVETRDGRRGAREVEVAAGATAVREQLLLDPPGVVRCTVDVSALARLPERVTVSLSPANAGRVRVPGRAASGELGDQGAVVRLGSESERVVEVVVAVPGEPVTVRAMEPDAVGEATVKVTAGQRAELVLRLEPAVALAFATRTPAPFDLLLVQWQRADGSWSAPQPLSGCRGRTEIGQVRVPGSARRWRTAHTRADGGQVPREGAIVIGPDGSAHAIVE